MTTQTVARLLRISRPGDTVQFVRPRAGRALSADPLRHASFSSNNSRRRLRPWLRCTWTVAAHPDDARDLFCRAIRVVVQNHRKALVRREQRERTHDVIEWLWEFVARMIGRIERRQPTTTLEFAAATRNATCQTHAAGARTWSAAPRACAKASARA